MQDLVAFEMQIQFEISISLPLESLYPGASQRNNPELSKLIIFISNVSDSLSCPILKSFNESSASITYFFEFTTFPYITIYFNISLTIIFLLIRY
jgi:hypothetical protein